MIEALNYPFFQNAFISIIFLSSILPLLGIFLSIKRIAFISDAFSHTVLLGVALGYLLSLNSFITSFLWLFLCTILIFWAQKKSNLNYDLIIMLTSILGMAGGILILSLLPLSKGIITGFLFGNILLISKEDILILALIWVVFLLLFKYFWKDLLLTSINEDLAYTENIKTDLINFGFLIFLSLIIITSIKIAGALLVSALMLLPVSISKLIANSFKELIIISIFWSELLSVAGLFISYFLNLPPGPTIALLGIVILIITLTIKNLVVK